MEYLLHFANVLLLVSYSVRDVLWLRWFAVAGAIAGVPYYLVRQNVLWPPVLWAGVFTVINLYQIFRIYMERRAVVLSAEEQKLYDMGFHALRPREFVSLVLTGEWRDAAKGQQLLKEGERVSSVCIAIAGNVHVRRHDRDLGELRAGHLIGTAMALTGDASQVDASFSEPGRYIRWPLVHLREFIDKRPELRAALQGLVNRDLATKLERIAAA